MWDCWMLILLLIKSHLGGTRGHYGQLEYIWHVSLWNRGHPGRIRKSVSYPPPSITANEMVLCDLAWTPNLTFMPSDDALADQGCQRIQGDGPRCNSTHLLCVLRADKGASACSLSGLTFVKPFWVCWPWRCTWNTNPPQEAIWHLIEQIY